MPAPSSPQAVSSRPGRAPDSGARALALLRLLLPDFDTAAAGVAQTDVRLRAVADRLSRLSMAGLSRQESSIMGLFSGVLARGAAEPEERAARNGIVSAAWGMAGCWGAGAGGWAWGEMPCACKHGARGACLCPWHPVISCT